MKRKGFTLIEALTVIAIIGILAVILFPVFSRARWPATKSSCFSNLKQIGLAFAQYTQDYNDLYPRIAAAGESSRPDKSYPNGVYGWADALKPYYTTPAIFQCPSETTSRLAQLKPQQAGYTDYWFNSRLASTKKARHKNPASIIMAGDGNDGGDLTDACYAYGSLPGAWIDSDSSPAYRHLKEGNYIFIDGHVTSLKPDEIEASSPNGKNVTFRIK